MKFGNTIPTFFTYFNLMFGGESWQEEMVSALSPSSLHAVKIKKLAYEDDNDALLALFLNRGLSDNFEYELPHMTFQVKDGVDILLEKKQWIQRRTSTTIELAFHETHA